MHHNQNLKPINCTHGPLFLNEWLGLFDPERNSLYDATITYISSSRLASHVWLLVTVAYGQSISNGAALFQKACIGCHDMGGNLLQPVSVLISFRFWWFHICLIRLPPPFRAPLCSWKICKGKPAAALPHLFCFFGTLRYVVSCRNGVATEEGIYDITYYGKGRMPASSHLLPLYYLFFCNWSINSSESRICIIRVSERDVRREVNAHLDHGCRRMKSSS